MSFVLAGLLSALMMDRTRDGALADSKPKTEILRRSFSVKSTCTNFASYSNHIIRLLKEECN